MAEARILILSTAVILVACSGRADKNEPTDVPNLDAVSGDHRPPDAIPPDREPDVGSDSAAGPVHDYQVPLASDSPWPKFRRDAAQTGRSPVKPNPNGGSFWSLKTDKGIFSTPVVAGDGTIYVGSADRVFYAINPDGSVRWQEETQEIIDSSALLDDKGRVYWGSGDGVLRAREASTGAFVWDFHADPPEENQAFINWFEGNVAMAPDGTLYVPNDNWFVYAVDRDTGEVKWRFKTPDQTWALPAVDASSGMLYVGNNNLLRLLGDNFFALSAQGEEQWSASTIGTIAASPLLAGDVLHFSGFDGYHHALKTADGPKSWSFPVRDHNFTTGAAPSIAPASSSASAQAVPPPQWCCRQGPSVSHPRRRYAPHPFP